MGSLVFSSERNQLFEVKAKITFTRLAPRLEDKFASYITQNPDDWHVFCSRLESNFQTLFNALMVLYGDQYDFYFHLEDLLVCLAKSWIDRSGELKQLDAAREGDPLWFQSNHMLGGVCYVDLFAGDLRAVQEKIPYFKELGLTYLHLMPLFKVPESENDGGYAVSSYRDVRVDLGRMEDLTELAKALRNEGISLVLDLVFNHTSNEHEWAVRALQGDPEFQDYYRMYSDRQMPDAYEKNLREIFPDEHPGAFTYNSEMKKWVWTTFHAYQWDLNYANPVVFNRMAEEMLFLANVGVEVLRLDAVAFIWKQMGTNCENLPGAHTLIQAFNSVARIAAPALLFKSEAIVHPDEVVKYIAPGECQLSYNPLLMALLWSTLATRQTNLLQQALRDRHLINPGCAWVNYVRCHDDIGWTFSDEDASQFYINGYDHRKFLNNFYTGSFPGSFARGLPFQENPKTGDMRISGTCASLAGLEKALNEEKENEVELAIRRILLMHSIILSIGGIPLIYLGDEIGMLNEYSYRRDPAKTQDSRWVHRPDMDWEKAARRNDRSTIEGRIYQSLLDLVSVRKQCSALANADTQVIDTQNEHVLGYMRRKHSDQVLILSNFSEDEQVIPANLLRLYGQSYTFTDLVTGQAVPLSDIKLAAFQFVWLV